MGKTVIFGGTFDPIHLSHEQILLSLQNNSSVDTVLLTPTKRPVHKAVGSAASDKDRRNMCEFVLKKYNKTKLWDIELKREEKSYTYYTLLSYKKSHSDVPYFVMGADMLVTLSTWYRYKDLLKLCKFMVFFRSGENKGEFCRAARKAEADGAEIEILPDDIADISSTEIRKRIEQNLSISEYVSPEVEEYIKANGLYKGGNDMTVSEYKNHIRQRLGDRRYFHSLCVAEEAVRLADRYGADKEKAYIAGLLHDVLKETPDEEQLKFAKEFGIILSDLELSAPKLYHSIIGSAYIKHILGVDDEEIISAVRYHTTARANMTKLEAVLYLADYTSRDRDYDGVEEMRKAVDESPEKALQIALKFTVNELKEKGVPVHPDTLAAYKSYVVNGDKL